MDPNATWQMLCESIQAFHHHTHDEDLRATVIALLDALAHWLRHGGFPPTSVREEENA
jgi:hypothetical protein